MIQKEDNTTKSESFRRSSFSNSVDSGDWKLRRAYANAVRAFLEEEKIDPDSIEKVLDVGCSTGRSCRALREVYPEAHVTGIDLSPYFLAVGHFLKNLRETEQNRTEPISFVHSTMEKTPFEDASFDAISICLVLHECPADAIRDSIQESFRLLRPGGVLSLMDGAPKTFDSIDNIIAFAMFRATEPWILEYLSFPFDSELESIGFQSIRDIRSSAHHRTVTAIKPVES